MNRDRLSRVSFTADDTLRHPPERRQPMGGLPMRIRDACLLVAPLAMCAAPGNALQEFHGAEPAPVSMGWPEGLAALVKTEGRFAGTTGFADAWACYAAEIEELNAFLVQYAQLPETRLRVVLHPGRLRINLMRHDGTDRTKDADWMLVISERYDGRQDSAKFGDFRIATWVDIYFGGRIRLEALDVPANVDVVSGGEIEGFVRRHQEKQRASGSLRGTETDGN